MAARRAAQRPLSWLDTALGELAEHLNLRPVIEHEGRQIRAFDAEEVSSLWQTWESTVRRFKALPPSPGDAPRRSALRPLVSYLRENREWARRTMWTVDTDGRVVPAGQTSPQAEALALVAQVLDFAAKEGEYTRALDRLRRCSREACRQFFDDRARSRVYCSGACRRAGQRPGTVKRVRRHRERRTAHEQALGLAASPRCCRDPRLLTSPGQRERVSLLREHFDVPDSEARGIVDREVARLQRVGEKA